MNSIKEHIRLGFIEPFRSPGLFLVYIAAMFGVAGIFGAQIFLTFNLAQQGPTEVMVYLGMRFLLVNFLWLPWLLYISERWKWRNFIAVQCILSAICMVYIILCADTILADGGYINTIILGVINAIVPGGFWALYHSLMTANASDDNHGNDISIADIALTIGNIFGAILAGVSLAFIPGVIFLSGCFICIFISIFIFGYNIKKHPPHQRPYPLLLIWHALYKKPKRTINSALQGAHHLMLTFLTPVWLAVIGLSGLGTGLVMALQTFLKFIISPFVGHMTNQNHGKEGIVGTTITTAGWLPWLFTQAHWLLLPSSVLWFIGSQFYLIGVSSRWYMERSTAYPAARELCLGAGRMVAVLIGVPLLYWNVTAFFIFVTALSVLTVISSLSEAKSLRRTLQITPPLAADALSE